MGEPRGGTWWAPLARPTGVREGGKPWSWAGESFADCARRECREELGCEVELDGLLAVLSSPSTQIHRYPDGRIVQFLGVVFRGRLGARRDTGDGEITEVRWFSSDELLEPQIMPADLPAIQHALSSIVTPLVD